MSLISTKIIKQTYKDLRVGDTLYSYTLTPESIEWNIYNETECVITKIYDNLSTLKFIYYDKSTYKTQFQVGLSINTVFDDFLDNTVKTFDPQHKILNHISTYRYLPDDIDNLRKEWHELYD